ncbi:MAG: hypothetical protein ACM3N5_06055 [Candidatus Eiseniibacteriota bacterium]
MRKASAIGNDMLAILAERGDAELADFSASEQLTGLLYAALMPAARVLVDNVAAEQRDQILGWTSEMLSDMVRAEAGTG